LGSVCADEIAVGRVHTAQHVQKLPVVLRPKSLMAAVFYDDLGTASGIVSGGDHDTLSINIWFASRDLVFLPPNLSQFAAST